jgi:hypothetical protein
MSTFGPSFDDRLDGSRLMDQMKRILNLMLAMSKEDKWVTLEDIEMVLDYPQASISAQLRHLRKARFGGYQVLKRRVFGHWEYQIREPLKTDDFITYKE